MEEQAEVIRSGGNVFEDMGLPNPEERLAKAKLVSIIADLIVERKLSQTKAAQLVGVDQPTLSKLLRGRTSGFSMERLVSILVSLGQDVDIKVRSHEVAAARVSIARSA